MAAELGRATQLSALELFGVDCSLREADLPAPDAPLWQGLRALSWHCLVPPTWRLQEVRARRGGPLLQCPAVLL